MHTPVLFADLLIILLVSVPGAYNYEDEILSAEIIYDMKQSGASRKEIEMLSIW